MEELWKVFNTDPQSTKDSKEQESAETRSVVETEGKAVVDSKVEDKSLEPHNATKRKRKRDKAQDKGQALQSDDIVDIEAGKMKRKEERHRGQKKEEVQESAAVTGKVKKRSKLGENLDGQESKPKKKRRKVC